MSSDSGNWPLRSPGLQGRGLPTAVPALRPGIIAKRSQETACSSVRLRFYALAMSLLNPIPARHVRGLRSIWSICAAAVLLVIAATAGFAGPARASTAEAAQTAWRLLDYIAVDYRGAVSDGRVTSTSEYSEMVEFSGSIEARIAELPATRTKAKLQAEATSLKQSIAVKAAPDAVAKIARSLGNDILAAYPVPLAPTALPDLPRGETLYSQNCASCHGATGDGRGPAAASLEPKPVAFRDAERARERSLFALYQVISQGIDGTAMPSFASLSPQDRWALAFRVGRFAFPKVETGAAAWQADAGVRSQIPDLKTLVTLTPTELANAVGEPRADEITAYLRSHPAAAMPARPGSLSVVRDKLALMLTAYEAGDRDGAKKLALAAYLDGFEPVEPLLAARDPTLMGRIESEMGALRAAIDRGESAANVRQRLAVLDTLFTGAEEALSPDAASTSSTFIGAFTILLREGLEALLIVVAMLAFLRKADRPDMVRYVHGGWVAALGAGGVTWAIATYFIGVSGASRELTEGFGSLFAAIVLLSVGIWMHGKSQAGEWQRYVHDKLGRALTRSSAWFLFGLAFLVVYREVFETILFYATLTAQGNGTAVVAGAGSAMAVLAVTGWVMLRYSRTLPVAAFFKYSSWLIAILAVVLAGKGVAALQEAGIIDIAPLAGAPRVPMLGIFPTLQSIGAQAIALVTVAMGIWYNERAAVLKLSK